VRRKDKNHILEKFLYFLVFLFQTYLLYLVIIAPGEDFSFKFFKWFFFIIFSVFWVLIVYRIKYFKKPNLILKPIPFYLSSLSFIWVSYLVISVGLDNYLYLLYGAWIAIVTSLLIFFSFIYDFSIKREISPI